ncbi:MAG TPA: response regulator [Terriglobales bacterium]|nr:response regulator [Terriglobales bacterium]
MGPEALTRRILFVDDEASIRLTLPPVLRQAGFEVQVAESVGDAIFEINSHQFDALISDLNIGEEGDGFLVTTAMRHIQPNCVTFILTGYPAFETALQAIHSNVDGYLVKPVEVEALITAVKERLTSRFAKLPFPVKRLSALLQENADSLVANTIKAIKHHATTSGSGAISPDLARHMREFVSRLASQLEQETGQLDKNALRFGTDYGKARAEQKGASVTELVGDFRQLEQNVYELVQQNLNNVDSVPGLIADLKRMNYALNLLLEQSLQGFAGQKSSRSKT